MASPEDTLTTPARRRQPTKGDLRERALLDAMERLLAERPLTLLSIDEIAREAGVTRTGFYFYFASKEAALRRLVEVTLASVWEIGGDWLLGEGEARGTLQRGMRGVAEAWAEHGVVLAALAEAAAYDAELRAFWHGQLEAFIEAVVERIHRDEKRGLVRAGLDARGVAEALCWMNERYCHIYLGDGRRQRDPEKLGDMLADIWSRAIYRD